VRTEHRYPRDGLVGDYLRAGFGLAVTVVPLVLVPVVAWVAVVLLAGAAVFGLFAWRTWERSHTVLVLDDAGLAVEGTRTRRVAWDALAEAKLRFYAPRRDREGGWMHMVVKGGGARIAADSTVDDFPRIAAALADAVAARGLAVDPITATNFAGLGFPIPGAEEARAPLPDPREDTRRGM